MRIADPRAPEIAPLIAAHLALTRATTPETSMHAMEAEALCGPDIRFWALYEHGVALGCGALKFLPDETAEVKSVHVAETARGRGLGRRIMTHLSAEARAAGCRALVLETGSDLLPAFDPARRLYESLGFSRCGPIPGYGPDPNSAFLRLGLDPQA